MGLRTSSGYIFAVAAVLVGINPCLGVTAESPLTWGDRDSFPDKVLKAIQEVERSGEGIELARTERDLARLTGSVHGQRVQAKLSVLGTTDETVELLPDVTWGWPTLTISELGEIHSNWQFGNWFGAVMLKTAGANSRPAPIIFRRGSDVPQEVAKHLMWNDKVLVTFTVDDVVVERPPAKTNSGTEYQLNSPIPRFNEPPKPNSIRTFCSVVVSDMKFLRSLTPEILWRTRTPLWPGPGTYPYLRSIVKERNLGEATFRSYAAWSGVSGMGLVRAGSDDFRPFLLAPTKTVDGDRHQGDVELDGQETGRSENSTGRNVWATTFEHMATTYEAYTNSTEWPAYMYITWYNRLNLGGIYPKGLRENAFNRFDNYRPYLISFTLRPRGGWNSHPGRNAYGYESDPDELDDVTIMNERRLQQALESLSTWEDKGRQYQLAEETFAKEERALALAKAEDAERKKNESAFRRIADFAAPPERTEPKPVVAKEVKIQQPVSQEQTPQPEQTPEKPWRPPGVGWLEVFFGNERK